MKTLYKHIITFTYDEKPIYRASNSFDKNQTTAFRMIRNVLVIKGFDLSKAKDYKEETKIVRTVSESEYNDLINQKS